MAESTVAHPHTPISRAEAKASGAYRFFTGRPCKHGHLAYRYTSNGRCSACDVKWREENRARSREIQNAFTARNAEKERARIAKWRTDNPDYFRDHHLKNRDRILAQAKVRYLRDRKAYIRRARERYRKNAESLKTYYKAYREANQEAIRAHSNNRRARFLRAEGSHTPEQIKGLLRLQKHRCANCKYSVKRAYHVDHVVPLAKGGSNDIGNLQILCPTCNRRKSAKDPVEWAQENGRLI